MKKNADLMGLKMLSAAKLMSERTQYARCITQETVLRRHLTDLQSRKAFSENGTDGTLGSLATVTELRWHRWIDARKATINSELAGILAEKIKRRQALKIAFGKDLALGKLLCVQQRTDKKKRNRAFR